MNFGGLAGLREQRTEGLTPGVHHGRDIAEAIV